MNIEIAKTIEILEETFREVEERRARERIDKALQGEAFVFVRRSKIREFVYLHYRLYDHFDAKRFTKEFATKTNRIDYFVDSIVEEVVSFFKKYDLYRKPVPSSIIEMVVEHYFNVVKARRRIYVITKNASKSKRSQKVLKAHESLGLKAQGREALSQTKAPMVITR